MHRPFLPPYIFLSLVVISQKYWQILSSVWNKESVLFPRFKPQKVRTFCFTKWRRIRQITICTFRVSLFRKWLILSLLKNMESGYIPFITFCILCCEKCIVLRKVKTIFVKSYKIRRRKKYLYKFTLEDYCSLNRLIRKIEKTNILPFPLV